MPMTMQIVGHFSVFTLNALGAVLIYASVFLYEDEEGRFHNKVERWQLNVREKGRASRSIVAAFMQEVARLTGRGFDRVFGNRLFSARVVPVSIYLSIASMFLLIVIMFSRIKTPGAATRQGAFAFFLYFVALALVPAFFKNKWILAAWWSVIPIGLLNASGFLLFVIRKYGAAITFYGIGLVALIFVSSLACDLIYIGLTRYVLRLISRIDRIPVIILMVFLNLLALVVPLLGPIYVGVEIFRFAQQAGAMVLVSLAFNSIDFFAGFAGLFVALLLLLHRLFWPVVERPLYAIYRYDPIRTQKKLVFRIGVALVLLSHHFTISVLKTILEKV